MAAAVETVRTVAVVVVGDGPYDLSPLAGVPAVARAVRTLLSAGVAPEVALLAPPALRRRALAACAGLPVVGRVEVPDDGIVVLHEAARPLAPPALAVAGLAAVRAGASAAVPVLALTDTVKRVENGALHTGPDRVTLRVVQSPVAFRVLGGVLGGVLGAPGPAGRNGPADGGAGGMELPSGALDLVARCAAAGRPAHVVAGDPAAFPLRTPWDLELAAMVLDGLIGGSG